MIYFIRLGGVGVFGSDVTVVLIYQFEVLSITKNDVNKLESFSISEQKFKNYF